MLSGKHLLGIMALARLVIVVAASLVLVGMTYFRAPGRAVMAIAAISLLVWLGLKIAAVVLRRSNAQGS